MIYGRIDLKKTIYTKAQYSKVINTKFSELGATSINEDLVGESNVALFFEQYNTLFYEIPAEGDTNSHEFLIKTSQEYIGYEEDNENKCGVIFNPITNEMYLAEKGNGAYLNNSRIRVSNKKGGTKLVPNPDHPENKKQESTKTISKINKKKVR